MVARDVHDHDLPGRVGSGSSGAGPIGPAPDTTACRGRAGAGSRRAWPTAIGSVRAGLWRVQAGQFDLGRCRAGSLSGVSGGSSGAGAECSGWQAGRRVEAIRGCECWRRSMAIATSRACGVVDGQQLSTSPGPGRSTGPGGLGVERGGARPAARPRRNLEQVPVTRTCSPVLTLRHGAAASPTMSSPGACTWQRLSRTQGQSPPDMRDHPGPAGPRQRDAMIPLVNAR